jgi:hypothetical protein
MPIYTFTTFNDPSASAGTTQAFGINDSDQIVGQYKSGTITHGFLESGDTFTPLDDPNALRGYVRDAELFKDHAGAGLL